MSEEKAASIEFDDDKVSTQIDPQEINKNPEEYFSEMQNMKNELNLKHLSMGMTNDYLLATKFGSTFLRIGTKVFGERVQLINLNYCFFITKFCKNEKIF